MPQALKGVGTNVVGVVQRLQLAGGVSGVQVHALILLGLSDQAGVHARTKVTRPTPRNALGEVEREAFVHSLQSPCVYPFAAEPG